MKGKFAGTAGRGPFNDTMERVGVPEGVTLSHAISRLGITAALNQDCTAIYHNGLASAESFLHQKQIGLRYVMSLTDSANRETLSHAFE